jgi:hypothetical protein
LVLVRTLVDPTNPKDVEVVHTLQDAIKVSQNNPGRFEVPNWDQTSRKKVHDALLVLGATVSDTKGMFGNRAEVDPLRHLIATAAARQQRLSAFPGEGAPPTGVVCELLCEDHVGTYTLPYLCQWSNGTWRSVQTGEPVQGGVVGWRISK